MGSSRRSEKWAQRPVHPVGTPEYTGFGDFLQHHLFGGLPLAANYEFAPESGDILRRIGEDPAAVGVAAGGHIDGKVKSVATIERFLYVYVRRVPGQPIDPVTKAYVSLILSPQGQSVIASQANGYPPLTAEEAAKERAKLDETDPAEVTEPVQDLFLAQSSSSVTTEWTLFSENLTRNLSANILRFILRWFLRVLRLESAA